MKVSVIIPAFNEEESITSILQQVKNIQGLLEIIVVDDGSTDGTAEAARKTGVMVVRNPYNMGYGASLKNGIRKASGNYIIIMDSDGQHNPEYIESIVEHLERYDMVVGSRTRDSHFSLLRKPGKVALSALANYISGYKIPDLNSGFRGFSKGKAMEFINILPNTFSFTTTITMAFFRAGYSIKYVPIITDKRKGGKSRVVQVKHGFQSILLIIRIIMLFNPLKILAPVSVVLFTLGIAQIAYACMFIRIYIPAGAILLILFSIISFFFGAIADQISSL